MRIPILTYHSMKIDGNDYGNNDHVALAEDLKTIDGSGFIIRPLHEVVALWSSAPHRLHGASHSWDHNHETLSVAPFPEVPRGTFKSIETEAMADHEIAQAQAYLTARAPNPDAAIFCYPYGESNDFLVHDYLPRRGTELGLAAAVSDGAEPMTPDSERWKIPRFVFGRDWTAPGDLQRILDDARHG